MASPADAAASAAPVEPPLFSWLTRRAAGVLLHPTSFPGTQGIGTLDRSVDRFLDFLEGAGMRYWQTCPLGPTGYGDSPYQCFSAFAGNPYLIDLQELASYGLLEPEALAPLRALPVDRTDFGSLYRLKWPLLRQAFERFSRRRAALPYGEFSAFKAENEDWLPAYALFRALKDHFQGQPWWEWPAAVRSGDAAQKSPLRRELAAHAEAHAFYQYVFFGQWRRIRAAALQRGITLIGDVPIFSALDSSDVWSQPGLFEIDEATSQPLAVAGVPPDYFSADGQLWGNPLYRWDVHAADGYAWWMRRLRATFAVCDVVRIDHFRGFEAYWRIPYPASTARDGAWVKGPGLDFFRAAKAAFPSARIIAEDLGEITPEVAALRERTGLPGMGILQFAFGGKADNPYLPHNLNGNEVVYPGTHDNDTTLGWYATALPAEQDHVRRYFNIDGREIGWDFIRAAYKSVCRLAVISLPDLLSLGSDARFNTPGKGQGNWQWRFQQHQLDALLGPTSRYLRELGELYGRWEPPPRPAGPLAAPGRKPDPA